MPQVPLQLGVIGQIAVPVIDLERAVKFYRDTLGIKFLFQVPNLAFFDCAGRAPDARYSPRRLR
jgi:catechol 2,3-dioxygenase-like lactoylglutathione lyase family enzyme